SSAAGSTRISTIARRWWKSSRRCDAPADRQESSLMAGPFDSASDEVDPKTAIYDRRLAGRLLRFLAPYRREVVLSVLLLATISLLDVTGPYLTKVAIDTYVKPATGHGALPAAAARGLLV